METEFFPNYDLHCTFKMNNTPQVPFFSLVTDFCNQRILIIPPPRHKMHLEQFEKWILGQILAGLPVSLAYEKKWFRLNRLVVRPEDEEAKNEKSFALFSKILDRFLTKKRNYVFEPYSFCLIRRRH